MALFQIYFTDCHTTQIIIHFVFNTTPHFMSDFIDRSFVANLAHFKT